MKRIAIGDTHGRHGWRKFLDGDFDEFYFVGDYFDDYQETPAQSQIVNFFAIVSAARKDPRIKLCLGNHDFHYLRGLPYHERYSGYQRGPHWDITIALESAMDVIKPVYVTEDKYIISHAGVTKTFMDRFSLTDPLEINDLFLRNRMSLAWVGHDPYGNDPENGPIWVRPEALLGDKLGGYKQIVGHTKVQKILTQEDVTFIDVDTSNEVFEF